MPRRLSDDDYDAIADAVARAESGREANLGPGSRVQIGAVWAVICGAVVGAVWFAGVYFEFRAFRDEAVTIEFMREWAKEVHRLNPAWKAPDPDKIHREIK